MRRLSFWCTCSVFTSHEIVLSELAQDILLSFSNLPTSGCFTYGRLTLMLLYYLLCSFGACQIRDACSNLGHAIENNSKDG